MSDLSEYGGGSPHRVESAETNEEPGDWVGVRSRSVGDTTLVNLRDLDDDSRITKIDRSSEFGNPFQLKKDGGGHTREDSVRRYRLWFAERVGESEGFRESVEELHGETLGCWCVGEAPDVPDGFECHGDVILEFLARFEEELAEDE